MPERQDMVTKSGEDGHQLGAKVALEIDDHGSDRTFCASPQSAEFPANGRIRGATVDEPAYRLEIVSQALNHSTCLALEHAGP